MMAPLLLVAALLGAWQLYVDLADVDEIILPAPADVARSLVEDADLLWENFQATAIEVAGGILLALVAGAGLAIVLHLSEHLRRAFYPLLVASQSVPVPVLAPLLVVWLGFSILPKLVIIALVCFFPIVVTMLDALRRVDPQQLKLMRTLDASRGQILRFVELPAALPAAISGAKVALAVAVIGAVLAESAGAEKGLGVMITKANSQYDIATSFAAVVVLGVFSIALFYSLELAQRRLAPWTGKGTP